jgi:hypothetical protein
LAAILLLPPASHLSASTACSGGGGVVWDNGTTQHSEAINCKSVYRCYTPLTSGVSFSAGGCNPRGDNECSITANLPVTFPGNEQNLSFIPTGSYATVIIDGPFFAECGTPSVKILTDEITVSWDFTASCNGGATFDIDVIGCPCFTTPCPVCEMPLTLQADLSESELCRPPPGDSCPLDNSCQKCAGTGGSASPTGGGAGVAPDESGPGAQLVYSAGAVGHPGFPGTAAWTPTLGRYWSHDYAERIIVDPDEDHVWLITQFGTFREFSALEAAGPTERTYETNSPSNEYRTLVFVDETPPRWELRSLDGTIQHFDEDGLWTSTVDRTSENETLATYTAAVLTEVTFPDGRSETFSYYEAPDPAEGKLHQITEVGVLDADSRSWTYHWDGDDLLAIDRPDGRAGSSNTTSPGFRAT